MRDVPHPAIKKAKTLKPTKLMNLNSQWPAMPAGFFFYVINNVLIPCATSARHLQRMVMSDSNLCAAITEQCPSAGKRNNEVAI